MLLVEKDVTPLEEKDSCDACLRHLAPTGRARPPVAPEVEVGTRDVPPFSQGGLDGFRLAVATGIVGGGAEDPTLEDDDRGAGHLGVA